MNKEELEQAFNETTDNAVDLLKKNVELKKRIDKAIVILKAMKHCEILFEGKTKTNVDKLLDILKGSDKE